MGGCVACGGCNATGRCVRGGLVNDAIDAMETADALVLASPVHYAGISGAMSAFCDRLYVIDHGRIIASGTPREVLTVELLRDVFGVDALIDNHPLSGYPRITWITQA